MKSKTPRSTQGSIGHNIQRQSFTSQAPVLAWTLAPLAAPWVGQHSKLVKDKLNIVGERHDESGVYCKGLDRRRDEQLYSLSKAGGKYWQECEFRAREATKKEPEHQIPFADPFHLQVDQMYSYILKEHHFLKTFLMCGKLESARSCIVKLINLMWSLHSRLDCQQNGLYPGTTSIKGCSKVLTSLIVLQNQGSIIRQTIHQLKNAAEAQTYEQTTQFQAFYQELTNLCQSNQDWIAKYDIPRPKDITRQNINEIIMKVVLERSLAIHKVAEQRGQTTRGVWKIGEDHVQDIKRLGLASTHYNLVTREEFNREFLLEYPKAGYFVEEPYKSLCNKIGLTSHQDLAKKAKRFGFARLLTKRTKKKRQKVMM
ncbi:hypothetical protein BKI52_33250 [marine bacterium AO1-C]|nr:hypothetical protein BKI52_33250 [marine bacterium AO1-C]